MFIDEIWDFKSINMAHELGIAGEFIYDSARKAMALRNLYNDYELNSILYNGAVGIERLQKIYLCLSIPNPMDKSTVPECLKKHNHNELVIYALSDFLIMILSWLVKQSLRAFLFQEVQP